MLLKIMHKSSDGASDKIRKDKCTVINIDMPKERCRQRGSAAPHLKLIFAR